MGIAGSVNCVEYAKGPVNRHYAILQLPWAHGVAHGQSA